MDSRSVDSATPEDIRRIEALVAGEGPVHQATAEQWAKIAEAEREQADGESSQQRLDDLEQSTDEHAAQINLARQQLAESASEVPGEIHPEMGFWAKITSEASGGGGWYAVQRLEDDASTEATPESTWSDDEAKEVNETEGLADDTVIWCWPAPDGELRFECYPKQGFWAEITSHSSPTQNRWTYGFKEVEKTSTGYGGWSDVSGGTTGTAYNTIEDSNTGSGTEGCGVDVDNLSTDDYTFTIQPASTGVIVWMRAVPVGDTTEYWFSYVNGVDGSCE
ncbi:MAG: hypothetical protein KGY99_10635 [Phycisphaerae bacterium]|nr:hypothetical protein [Phycisphaerae bacterium]